ncbi:MAG: haloacid dehalogenase-like hydrolase [Negativicutes bacterium]|nr:haloacid dehalogenase-like hydrolase [Negativicutes bacterium]
MKILFWDIDGTLVRTGKAGLYAFVEATRQLFGKQPDFSRITTAGMTDCYIASRIIFEITGRDASDSEIAELVGRYEELLPLHLAEKSGYAIPPVTEILARLDANPDYISLLLTGNTVAGAKAKLTVYELAHYFDFSASAFGDSCQNRSEVAARALGHLRGKHPEVGLADVYVIGDTPNDIRVGKEMGARTVAVATGTFSLQELAAHSPWWVVNALPSAAEFVDKLAEPV